MMMKLVSTLILLLSSRKLANAAVVEQSSTFTAQFSFEPMPNGDVLPTNAIRAWESATSAFFANMYAALCLDFPIIAPGVVMEVQSQQPYGTTAGGYGTNLEVQVIVTMQSEETANHDVGFLALRIFDTGPQGNYLFFTSYLTELEIASDTHFGSISSMDLDVSTATPVGLNNPVPTNPPQGAPVTSPITTAAPAETPVTGQNPAPTMAPVPLPTMMPVTRAPTIKPTLFPTIASTTLSPTGLGQTRAPTFSPFPTAARVLQYETYFTTTELVLWGTSVTTTGVLQGNSIDEFVRATSDYLTRYVTDALENSSVEQVMVDLTGQSRGSTRRTRRRLQDSSAPPNQITVEFDSVLRVATTSIDAQSLINGAFATSTRRETYRFALAATGDSVLQSISSVTLPGGGNPDSSEDGLGTWLIIGISVGCGIFILALIGLCCCFFRNRDGDSKSLSAAAGSQLTSGSSDQQHPPGGFQHPPHGMMRGPFTQAGDTATSGGGYEAEIYVNHINDDVSSLGTQTFLYMDDGTHADKTVSTKSVKNQNFHKLMGETPVLGMTEEVEGESSDSQEQQDDASLERAYEGTR